MKKLLAIILCAFFLTGFTFVNKVKPLEENYEPENLVLLTEETAPVKKIFLEKETADQFLLMVQAMKSEGIDDLITVSGYRSYEYQKNLYNKKVSEYVSKGYSKERAAEAAGRIVAPPGTSEHQTGMAVDISNKAIGSNLVTGFEKTAVYKWVEANGYKYGFIIRYQKDKTDLTGIIYEPWHLRYIGQEIAEIIYKQNITLEEYYDSVLFETFPVMP